MAKVHELKSMDEWNAIVRDSSRKPVMLLKHSTRCPVSAEAYDHFLKHVGSVPEDSEVDYALVLVVEQRPVSNAIAEALGVKHESPQALLIKDGQAVWHTSHWRITSDALKEQVSRFK
jgi:bacillithiol system protein YtxJ